MKNKLYKYKKNDGSFIDDFVLNKDQRYKNNKYVKSGHHSFDYTEEQIVEIAKCSVDPIYFIETYLKTVDIDKGIVPFLLYDYQRDLIKSYIGNRFNVSLQARQSGKTAVTGAFILWFFTFNSYKNIAILGKKSKQAQGIVSRIRLMGEALPNFLKTGMTTYNKTEIESDNGSRIFSSSTTSDSIRGESVALLYCHAGTNTIEVRNKKTGKTEKIAFEEFYERL